MIDISRHEGIINPATVNHQITLLGNGGVGSAIATGLSRMGFGLQNNPLHLYDPDRFEAHNVANQFIDQTEVGKPKTTGLKKRLLAINPEAHISDRNGKARWREDMSGIVIVCVDSMTERKAIMESLLENNENINCVIETRMDATVGVSHWFNPMNTNQCDCWWLHWYPDEDTHNDHGCSGHFSIISAVYGTAMLALKQFEMFCLNGEVLSEFNRVYMNFTDYELVTENWPLDKPTE